MRKYKARFTEEFLTYILERYDNDVMKAADDMGCHPETVRRYCRKFDIKLPRGRKGKKVEMRKQRSKYAAWLKEFEKSGKELPQDYRAIADMSGITYKTIYMYYYNRKKEAKRVLLQRPWAGDDKSIILESQDGARVPVGSFAQVRAYVDRITGDIKLNVQTHSGQEFIFRYGPRELKRLFI